MSNNGTKFVNENCDKLYLNQKASYIKNMYLYSPQQNGVVARKYKHLL